MKPTSNAESHDERRGSASGAGRRVFKVLRPAERAALRAAGSFAGSPDDLRDGFVHLSAEDQLEGTLQRHFRGAGPLTVLEIDPARLPEGSLRWEVSRGGALFPHLYGALPEAAVVGETGREG